MEVKRYKACDAIAVVNGRIESADVVLATDYDLLSARHARAIESLRGCVDEMEWRGISEDNKALAAARAVLEETP